MRFPPARPSPRRAAGMVAPLAADRRLKRGVRHTIAAGLLSSRLFWSMVVVMLAPAILVGILVLLLHLAGVL